MTEVAHLGRLRIVTNGDRQLLVDDGTGEIKEIEPGKRFGLEFDRNGFAFLRSGLFPHERRDPFRVGELAPPSSRSRVDDQLSRILFKGSGLEDARCFVQFADKRKIWASTFAEVHTSLVWQYGEGDSKHLLQTWAYSLPIDGSFLFWDVPYFLQAMLAHNAYNCLKMRLRTWRKWAEEYCIPTSQIMGSFRSRLSEVSDKSANAILDLSRASQDAKISTLMLLLVLVSSMCGHGRSGEIEVKGACAIFGGFVATFLAQSTVWLKFTDYVVFCVLVRLAGGCVVGGFNFLFVVVGRGAGMVSHRVICFTYAGWRGAGGLGEGGGNGLLRFVCVYLF